MEKDDGRLGNADRATAAEPVVSALRDGIPDAVKLVLRRDIIKAIPSTFRQQHGRSLEQPSWRQGMTRGDILKQLDALDLENCSPSDVDDIIGNQSWTANDCDVCGRNADVIARIGDEPDYDARWQDICLPCLVRLGDWARRASP